ncbi:sulfurtransferase [Reinekea sp.]|jgi:thiosulfate/3-mercaptopyruvate sulfurtransferase|uniref:sulfurtransferase n=1 Tax=Reinekea sp. TaxID=1970455 RepID=UPI0039891DFB
MTPLISISELIEVTQSGSDIIILDCRSDLTNRDNAINLYLAGHIPGAIHAHLEDDLSGPIIEGKTSRHPLPSRDAWQATLRRWGIQKDSTIVVYDQQNSMFAARAWWMLLWAGINNVKVLDGGLDAWLKAEQPLEETTPTRTPSNIDIKLKDWVITADQLLNLPVQILDARALPRYAGEVEPLDTKAGHIPGALNADFSKNLQSNGHFQTSDALAQRFEQCDDQVVCYCGSGVSACHNILAFAIARRELPKLYAGSWSEWITVNSRPIASGVEGTPL